MQTEILVNVEPGETRVAILEDGILVEVYYERPTGQRTVGSIFKGKVENVLPGMQAAFVDIGLERNAFLYVSDALPPKNADEEADGQVRVEHKERNGRLTIEDLLKPNQEVMVQVAKEAIGTKGARVTTHCTLPGRFLVLMPTVDYVGVSRRIDNDRERDRLRKIAERVRPRNMGLIVRTVAEGKSEHELSQDAEFLVKLWGKIQDKKRTGPAPQLLHKDMGLVYRVIRDSFTEDVDRFVIDSKQEYEKVLELLDDIGPSLKKRVELFYSSERTIFDLYNLEPEIEKALRRRVWLKSGGYLVIDRTEALTSIDVNTGKYVGTVDLADTVFRTNLEAAREIARQLRLRDIGGIIIADFIDMESESHRQKVLKTLEEHLRRDRTRTYVLGITQLGLVEITRKKAKQSLDDALQKPCPYCEGKGRVMSEESVAAKLRREVKAMLRRSPEDAILVEVHPAVAALLIGAGGTNLRALENETGKSIYIRGSDQCHLENLVVRAMGTREEVESKALPVRPGQILEVKVEEPHVSNLWDGIARVEGYVLDVEGGAKLVGERVRVEVTKVHRTYAKARVLEGEAS
ncbi:MAG: Rne/Rng family ribonuclease [Bacillota bacterium]|nr:MAG: Rne/Rng family ribonuclease [Bacillota bacterium]